MLTYDPDAELATAKELKPSFANGVMAAFIAGTFNDLLHGGYSINSTVINPQAGSVSDVQSIQPSLSDGTQFEDQESAGTAKTQDAGDTKAANPEDTLTAKNGDKQIANAKTTQAAKTQIENAGEAQIAEPHLPDAQSEDNGNM